MEELRSSRRAATKSAYGDVFGGPPRFSAPLAAKSDDYSEIFGGSGAASSSSIPFLDLPPADDGAAASNLDYPEIFGGFGGRDFAVSYEELFGKPKKPDVSTSNGRSPEEPESCQHEKEVPKASSESPSCEYMASSEKNQFSSKSNLLNDHPKQFNMSFHKTSRGSIEDSLSGTTHITELHAVPGFSFVIDSCSPIQEVSSENPTNIVANDGGLTDKEHGKVVPPVSSSDNSKSCEAELKANPKEFSTIRPAPEDGPANVKHHSRSSSNHSTSSGDISFTDFSYLGVSDISLRTQPSRVPPPSRAPPKLMSKQGHPKMKMHTNSRTDLEDRNSMKQVVNHQTHYSLGASKSDALHEAMKKGSSFFDVEVDASSAAAASAAAMKEAMEQAQARLKSAKELMERKRDNFQGRKKLGENGLKYDKRKDNIAAVETPKAIPKEDKKVNEFAQEDGQKVIRVAKASPEYKENEGYVMSAVEDRYMMQENGFKSSYVPYELEEVSAEWKTEKQFYELRNNEKIKTVKEAYKKEGDEPKEKATTKVNEDKENFLVETGLAYRVGRNGELQEFNKTSERNENVVNLAAHSMACKKEIRDIPNAILGSCLWKGNANKMEVVFDSHQQEDIEKKLEAAQQAHGTGQELKNRNAAEGIHDYGRSEHNVTPSNDACVLEVHFGEEKEGKLVDAREVSGYQDNEKEMGEAFVTFLAHEQETKLEMINETGLHDKNENKIKATTESGMWEAVEGADQFENSEKTRGNIKHGCDHEGNECKLDETRSAQMEEESRKLNKSREACMRVGNDSESKVGQDTNEMEDNSPELESAQDSVRHTEHETMNSAKEACWQDYNEMKTKETLLEVQQHVDKLGAEQAHLEQDNSEELTVLESDYGKGYNGKVKEMHVAVNLEEESNRLSATWEVCQKDVNKDPRTVNKDPEDGQGASLSKTKVTLQSLANDATESCHPVVTKNATADENKTEEREKERRMERQRELEKEQARKLEEEKEREREREKDRLAVEKATHEAHERALAEARERAERIAVEKVTAEARQRALAEAREKVEKATAEALEKSFTEKALKEAKLRAERAAVERATAEARERAVEKALAEKAAADARQRSEKLNAVSRDRTRKNNEGEPFRASEKEDRETKLKATSSDVAYDARFQSGSSSSYQRYGDSSNLGEGESPLRCKARLERHQRTVERAAKALAEKNMRDIVAQREQTERNRLAESLDADVRRWSSGKEGNLRALLSTLQYILGSESGWQPIPLTDVITAAAVKKAYRKATLCVHPDKLQQRGASIQQKYVCEKVFDLLKEAWSRFNSEER